MNEETQPPLSIAVVTGMYHEGTTAEYVARAFQRLGHKTKLCQLDALPSVVKDKTIQCIFCVDSGVPLDIATFCPPAVMKKVSFWLIDYRHNKDPRRRSPSDLHVARAISDGGGWIFQAQKEDVADAKDRGISRVSYLPLAADLEVWSDKPVERKQFDVGFIGSIWDPVRKQVLEQIAASGLSLGSPAPRSTWKGEAARVLRASQIGFNISSFYGTPVAFDVSMRFFETLSCGVPLLTNDVPGILEFFPASLPPFLRTYRSPSEVPELLKKLLADEKFLSSGSVARRWIEHGQSYEHRMNSAIATLGGGATIESLGVYSPITISYLSTIFRKERSFQPTSLVE